MTCIPMCSRRPQDGSHHPECPLYKTEKRPRLFYYEEAENFWSPTPERVDHIIDVGVFFADGDTHEIIFKRVDMTDEELDNLEEA